VRAALGEIARGGLEKVVLARALRGRHLVLQPVGHVDAPDAADGLDRHDARRDLLDCGLHDGLKGFQLVRLAAGRQDEDREQKGRHGSPPGCR